MIKGEKVSIRPMKKEDWEKTISWCNDMENKILVMSHPFPITNELEINWFESILLDKSNKSIYFSIDDLHGIFIGIVYISDIDWISGTCWFHIFIGDRQSRSKGYGKDVLILIIKYVFNKLNLRKIALEVIETNEKAINLYKKANFLIEGKLTDHYFYDDKFFSILIMSIFKDKI